MNMIPEQSGSCLCGSVSLIATPKRYHVGACHCETCRKWGGGPLLVVECGGDVRFDGAKNISVYNSSEWAERGFCQQCGTHLFYRLKQCEMYAIPVGLFDDNEHWQLTDQVFIESKPAFYSFVEKTTNLTGAELFAQFSGE